MSNTPILQLIDVKRTFRQGEIELNVLKGVNLELNPGEVVALVGVSGAGKSTLLQITGLLEQPTSGRILLSGQDVSKFGDQKRTVLRRDKLGFVYQYHHLLPEFTALENVMMPQIMAGMPEKQAKARAMSLLMSLGMDHRLDHRPSRLSGGEQQRVAILRALANKPALLLADEPTGNLDEKTQGIVFQELITLAREQNMAALIATHDNGLAKKMDRVVRLHNGLLETA